MNKWSKLADKVLQGYEITEQEGLEILRSDNDEILLLMDAAFKIRKHYFGKKVKLNMIKLYISAGAKRAHDLNSSTYCIVESGRGRTYRELDGFTSGVEEIKENYTDRRICTCLGILRKGEADKLKASGVDRYNHNLNTSKEHHSAITTSHTYDDRVSTVEEAKRVGISPCSGIIVGM